MGGGGFSPPPACFKNKRLNELISNDGARLDQVVDQEKLFKKTANKRSKIKTQQKRKNENANKTLDKENKV